MDFDNIGDFLYLILLAVFSIFGFLGKKKKVQKPGSPSQKSFFEKMLSLEDEPTLVVNTDNVDNSDIVENEKIVEEKEDVFVPVSSSKIKPSDYLLKAEKKEGIKDIIKHSEIGLMKSDVIPDLSDAVEIKKGIIFSELFKPKFLEM